MKVLLIEPPFSEQQAHVKGFGLPEPLSLEILAGNLQGHDVRILDMRLDGDLHGTLDAFQPDVVGAGCYTTGVYVTRQLLRDVKARDPRVRTVVGGHHASLIPQDFADEGIDFICVGEGEVTLRELADTLERRGDPRQVAGLAMRKDGTSELMFTGPRALVDLEAMPLPDRSLVARYRRQYYRGAWRPIMSLSTERGCPFRCCFCSMWKLNAGKYRVRSAESVVAEIAALESPFVDFIDDNTLHDVKRAHRIAELLKAGGTRKFYKAYARSDTVAKHPDLIEEWREVGLKVILVGFESFREADLQAYGKRNTIRNNEEALRILQANEIEIASYFVVNPNYTRDDFKALADYVGKWDLRHPIFTILTPLPGTDLYDEVRGRLTTRNYAHFDFFHAVLPTALPRAEFQRCFYDLWRNAYTLRNFWKKLQTGETGISFSQILGFKAFLRDLRSFCDDQAWR